jgi:sec-independent protein translocase protein TatB
MPGFGDSAFIVLLALLLFGPKKLPVLARQIGKLMADFRRASTEFRTQMEEELRISEQADRQKQIAAIEASAPPTPAISAATEPAADGIEPHTPAPEPSFATPDTTTSLETATTELEPAATPLPIASAGGLNLMPPATGLPTPRNSSLNSLLRSIPAKPPAETAHSPVSNGAAPETPAHANGASHEPVPEAEPETRPWMI